MPPRESMWRALNRAVGPSLALPIFAFERAQRRVQPHRAVRNYSEGFPRRLVFEIMTFAALYDSLAMSLPAGLISASQEDGTEANITKSIEHSHEEAMLLEEPESEVSKLLDEEESQRSWEALPIDASATNAAWKQLPQSITVQGVELKPSTTLAIQRYDNKTITLCRNGHGVRTVRAPFGYNLHVYVATLYTEHPVRNGQDVEELFSKGFVMEFIFLRDVSPSQMSIAWNYQLDTSVTHQDYERYAEDRAAFLESLDGSMQEGGKMRFEFHPNRMVLTNQGQAAGEIEGSDFSRAFASMWFGDQPVMEEIKEGLLRGDAIVEETEIESTAEKNEQQEEPVNI